MKDRIIFHIDANSAYLSWEAAYRLQHGEKIDLREIPSVVGGDEKNRHGIILAKSIPAKKYGIITGESLYSARNKCPNLTIVSPTYGLYIKCSNAMVNLLKEYSPSIQRYSIDEVFLDYTYGNMDYMKAAIEMKERIKNELGFTVNIGIGPNKLLAKMASDFKKPDMIHTLFHEEIPKKMWPLPVGELFMVGSRTRTKLNSRGIYTIGDLAKQDKDYLYSWLKKHGLLIWNYANGIEDSPVKVQSVPIKSVGNSTTTSFDVDTKKEACMILLSLSEMVSMRLRELDKCTNVISVSLKSNDFFSYSHQKKLENPTDITNTIYETAVELFEEMWKGEPIRRFSIDLSELSSNDFFQLSIFDNNRKKERKLDDTIDKIRCKYGHNSVFRSCFLYSGIKPITGGVVMEEEYPMMSSLL
ncbi:Y-family DNA polymerase [Anaerosalibacter sp. Marseille-P3206]|uniref:Y-family DNA polymerase n=1 Tax=Anaerosalibacter sp. Marseille-P3206 TaxID=1871005 RepID=UPI00098568DC|nr:DNA polymerase IV [Anaerosalibacter sp. Marseille-P3206]